MEDMDGHLTWDPVEAGGIGDRVSILSTVLQSGLASSASTRARKNGRRLGEPTPGDPGVAAEVMAAEATATADTAGGGRRARPATEVGAAIMLLSLVFF